MRISSQSIDTNVKTVMTKASSQAVVEAPKMYGNNATAFSTDSVPTKINIEKSSSESATKNRQHELSKGKLTEAVEAVNEFLKLEKRSAQFVLHEGLDKYYVRLVDAETEEVVKEIPPERLLDAFYEMQKLAGMIVDEKI